MNSARGARICKVGYISSAKVGDFIGLTEPVPRERAQFLPCGHVPHLHLAMRAVEQAPPALSAVSKVDGSAVPVAGVREAGSGRHGRIRRPRAAQPGRYIRDGGGSADHPGKQTK